jgi:SPX domain protein involved in polyphosphate accumulation|tara:strand:+ start:777 stop:1043 length:267 start_codon:yes stop_codon:yes gene_type:complete
MVNANGSNSGGKKTKKVTTIKVYGETKDRLDRLKEHHRESYDEVLRKVFYIFNSLRKDPEKAGRVLRKIDKKAKVGKRGGMRRYTFSG